MTCVQQCGEIDSDHPEAAFHADIPSGKMVLNCGAQVPIVGFYDDDNEPIEREELDLHPHIKIAFGPTPSGWIMLVGADRRDWGSGLHA